MHLGPPFRPPPAPKPGELPYRLFFLDGDGRRITHSHEFHATDDEAALGIAEAWREGRKVELWQRARVVKIWG
jgi:hypothetical protein